MPYTVNSLLFVCKKFARFARASSQIFLATMSSGCYNKTGLDMAWSRTLVVANHFCMSKSWNKVLANKSWFTVYSQWMQKKKKWMKNRSYVNSFYKITKQSKGKTLKKKLINGDHWNFFQISGYIYKTKHKFIQFSDIWAASTMCIWHFSCLNNYLYIDIVFIICISCICSI